MELDIGSKIKAARIEKKLTQEQVAELLGVSRQTISNWENEKSYPEYYHCIRPNQEIGENCNNLASVGIAFHNIRAFFKIIIIVFHFYFSLQ